MDFVQYCKEKTQATHLCLAGGVALNSVLNGRLNREIGFESVFIPPYPGDDGISIGCCAYGLYGNVALQTDVAMNIPPLWSEPLTPYLGPCYSDYEIRQAVEYASPWLDVETITDDDERLNFMVHEIESGGVIAWFHGRSEMGPRALGHRSILADPRKGSLARFINESVKLRETFRPFAPSVLVEEAEKWFELKEGGVNNFNMSPYMSMTASVLSSKRLLIPAVTHVDGSSRLQTVSAELDPLFYKLIKTFFKKTGVPMVLNTSFNTLKVRVVETNVRITSAVF
jgi:carbamoyltransferase